MKRPIKVTTALASLNTARFDASVAIMKAIADEAILRKLTRLELLVWENTYWRGDKQVRNARIDKLLELYEENIHSGGLMDTWDAVRGWGA